MSERPTQLYRHFDASGRLLYVGISLSAVHRLSQHKGNSWFTEIRRIDVETLPSRSEADKAETIAIRKERPAYNIAKKKCRARWSGKAPDGFIGMGEFARTNGIHLCTAHALRRRGVIKARLFRWAVGWWVEKGSAETFAASRNQPRAEAHKGHWELVSKDGTITTISNEEGERLKKAQ